MLKSYISIVILGGLLFLAACQKEDIPTYSDIERINFDLKKMNLTKDTVEISLGFFQGEVKELPLVFYVIGYPKDYARPINVQITSDNGAVAGVTYKLPDVLEIPKEVLSCTIPLNILRDPELETKSKSFELKLSDSEGLVPGLYTSLYVTVTDGIPTTWIGDEGWWYGDKLVAYFGECSREKYKFVYEQLGIYDFSVWTYYGYMGDAAKLNPAKAYLKKQLAAYEAEHGPMKDENGKRITFPD